LPSRLLGRLLDDTTIQSYFMAGDDGSGCGEAGMNAWICENNHVFTKRGSRIAEATDENPQRIEYICPKCGSLDMSECEILEDDE
jgi:hypothetical protein